MKNNLNDLNDYLFEELERLNDDESLSSDVDFDKEIKRSKAITDVASKIIDNASTLLKAVELQEEYGCKTIPFIQLGYENGKTSK